jgi:hypothetical protein
VFFVGEIKIKINKEKRKRGLTGGWFMLARGN